MALCDVPTANPNLPDQAKTAITTFCNEYILGFERAYKLTFYAAILAMILGAFLPGWPLRWEGRDTEPQAERAPRPVVVGGH